MHGKKCILAMGLFAVTAVVLAMSFAVADSDADGVDADITWYSDGQIQFSIGTEAELRGLAQLVNGGNTFEGKTINLTNDIQLNGDWTPIGTVKRSGSSYKDSYAFKGTFNGNGNTISGLSRTTSVAGQTIVAKDTLGLFGAVDGGTITNVLMDKVKIVNTSNENAGAIAGILLGGGTIEGCVNGSTGDEYQIQTKEGAGGIVGRVLISGTVKDCENFSKVETTDSNCGGIAGAAYYTAAEKRIDVKGCTDYGNISGGLAVGGVIGLSSAFVEDCTNLGDVTISNASDSSNYGAGGIVGEQKVYGAIDRCTNRGTISATVDSTVDIGGIVGKLRYSNAGVAGGGYPQYDIITVSSCVNYGDVINKGYNAGGIIGTLYKYGIVEDNVNLASKIELRVGTWNTAVGSAAGIAAFSNTGNTSQAGPDFEGYTIGAQWSGNVSTTPEANISGNKVAVFIYDGDKSYDADCTSVLPDDFDDQSDSETTVIDKITEEPVVSKTETATIAVSETQVVATMTVVTTNGSITLKNSTVTAGTITISVTDTTETGAPVVASAEKTFDVTVSDKVAIQEMLITFNVDVPGGKIPKVYSIVNGSVVEEKVVSYTSSTVTVSTNHNTPFSIALVSSFIPVPDNRGDDFPGYVPTQKTESPSDDSSTAQVAVIVGAIVVVLTAIVALLYRSR